MKDEGQADNTDNLYQLVAAKIKWWVIPDYDEIFATLPVKMTDNKSKATLDQDRSFLTTCQTKCQYVYSYLCGSAGIREDLFYIFIFN